MAFTFTFIGLNQIRTEKRPHTIRPYTLMFAIESDDERKNLASFEDYLEAIPDEFPYLVITKPKVNYMLKIISLFVGSLVKDISTQGIDEVVIRYINLFGPLIGKISHDVEVDQFRDIFMSYLCEHCKNTGLREDQDPLIFPIGIIRRDRSDNDGLGIKGWEEGYLVDRLLPAVANEGFIQVLGDRFRLTPLGRDYCDRPHRVVGSFVIKYNIESLIKDPDKQDQLYKQDKSYILSSPLNSQIIKILAESDDRTGGSFQDIYNNINLNEIGLSSKYNIKELIELHLAGLVQENILSVNEDRYSLTQEGTILYNNQLNV